MKKKIACIGSRDIPPDVEAKMEAIGEYIAQRGWYLGSGNALGADAAYARGANRVDPSKVIIYLPFPSYNRELIVPGNHIVNDTQPEWERLAAQHHPRFPLLTRGAKAMMVRNAGIVRNADFVIAYLNRTKIGGGGTGHGWRIAGELGIPRLDISIPKNLERAIEELSILL